MALRVLPDGFVDDRERLSRFENEARVLASLNHSHIASLYGLEQLDGRRVLVMELAEGEDLATRLRRGRIDSSDTHLAGVTASSVVEWTRNAGACVTPFDLRSI